MNRLITPFKTQERVYKKIFIKNLLQYLTSIHFNQRWKLFYNRYIFSIYKNLIYRNAIGYTIFLVNTSGVYTNKFDGFPTLEHAKYNWPWEKHGFSKSKPQIVKANAKRFGNCKRLNGIGESKGFIGIRGRSTTSPWNFPLKIVEFFPWFCLWPVACHHHISSDV